MMKVLKKPNSAADVVDILDGFTESVSKNTRPSLHIKEAAAMAVEVKAELVLCTLITRTNQELCEASFVRYATRLFEKYGIGLRSLTDLRNILKLFRQLQS